MDKTVEVLVIARRPQGMARLCESLAQQHTVTDVVSTEAEAFERFHERGGHRFLVFGPDVGKALLARVLGALRAVDPRLGAVCFGRTRASMRGLGDSSGMRGIRCIPDFHPSSRAGIGAVRRFLGENA